MLERHLRERVLQAVGVLDERHQPCLLEAPREVELMVVDGLAEPPCRGTTTGRLPAPSATDDRADTSVCHDNAGRG